ncbi:General stress protein 39 [Acaryochloris thomasi RCC1774]|uniref:General stress protein 39 n=1 Tax=Acaryochloris thomasi RCC1774 TaxID=1764569 RepID=A0A2W1JY27_9CYAN|nr:SDR family NAD(P)-dependent oxidoreductase [Acaryochloris thomasi]PZD74942.1 General stress protein 39 [Acaryochloris thomasi RCC1774]
MVHQPDSDLSNYRPTDQFKDKVALITGEDSGIGRAVAIASALEGANIAIIYHENEQDADVTCSEVEKHRLGHKNG